MLGIGRGGVALGVSGGVSKVVLPAGLATAALVSAAAATVELLVLRGEVTDFLIPEFAALGFRCLPVPVGMAPYSF